MQEELQSIITQAKDGVGGLQSMPDFEAFKANLMGSNGLLTQVSKGIGKLPKEDRPMLGKLVNETKGELEQILSVAFERIEAAELAKKIGPSIDPTLPSPDLPRGKLHPLTQVRREIDGIFRKLGFTVAEGPELETEWFCFDALNTSADHPARDSMDTLFFPKEFESSNVSKREQEQYLLRTHTSTVQIRTMLKEKPPLRIISPGRAFRRDTVDATHSANFHQVEGLYVDERVTVADLKAILDHFIREIFGKNVETRFRPSFFPFTEPSFEFDFRSPNLGKLSNKWIEIMGCGLVDSEVFKSCDYDAEKWSGYAFGMGIERIAMILFGIDDIRHFYNNDLRFLKQFS